MFKNLKLNIKAGLLLIFGMLSVSKAHTQTFTDSNLPIIIINTDGGASILDAPRILASMKIIYKGPGVRNAVADQNDPASLNYDGRISIEVRGSSSQALDKKQYGLSTLMTDGNTNNNVSLLGMPKENDWVLNGLAFDPSLIRDHISFYLSRAIGQYAPRTAYCEVMVNGVYRGLYMLQEKVKVDDKRVNINKIDQMDISLPNITGGYLIKADKVTMEDPSAWTMSSYLGINDVNFIYEFPKPQNITSEQGNYIHNQFSRLAIAASENNISPIDGYPSIIDVPSFIDFIILNELSANVDGYQFSTFFHKDKGGKLRAGPIWDLNLTYGNDLFIWGFDRSKTNTWQFDNGDNIGARFWKDLFNNSTFRCYLSKRWNKLIQPDQALSSNSIISLIDETVNQISEAVVRENSKWGSVGDHIERINSIKNFLIARITWISNSLGAFTSCSNVETPPFVISKIMYNAEPNSAIASSSDQEFIEITNNGDNPVNTTGIYFGGTGINYQFPQGYIFPPHGILYLANNLQTFEELHSFSPFGEFTRNLDNDEQRLLLLDAFGNIIDEVNYSSTTPWPEASANGAFIKLIDLNSDNNKGNNWESGNDLLSSNIIAGILNETKIEIFPNPTSDRLNIKTKQRIKEINLYSTEGKLLKIYTGDLDNISIDLMEYSVGIYFIEIVTLNGPVFKKIFKLNDVK